MLIKIIKLKEHSNHKYFLSPSEMEGFFLCQQRTLYSFRHTGAVKVYEKTGSLTILQQVMGHADLKTSLTYLRGLEIAELKEEDMPMV